jgi:hypothetical protein
MIWTAPHCAFCLTTIWKMNNLPRQGSRFQVGHFLYREQFGLMQINAVLSEPIILAHGGSNLRCLLYPPKADIGRAH